MALAAEVQEVEPQRMVFDELGLPVVQPTIINLLYVNVPNVVLCV